MGFRRDKGLLVIFLVCVCRGIRIKLREILSLGNRELGYGYNLRINFGGEEILWCFVFRFVFSLVIEGFMFEVLGWWVGVVSGNNRREKFFFIIVFVRN